MKAEEKWKEEVNFLKSIIEKTILTPTVKWGWDVYTHKNRNVVSCGGFKHFFTLWFYDGVFLSDPYKVLQTASKSKTKALRQWRFTSKDEIDEKAILAYLEEAIKNVEAGKVWRPEKSQAIEVPAILKNLFSEDKTLETAFENLSAYRQKEYIEHLSSAKKDETKMARLEKIKPMILRGIGLHDKYR